MNILLADDEEGILKILKVYLEKEGYFCYLAQDGEKAKEIFYEKNIDLAILDWMMPKFSGIELCKEFKANKNIKILMLTAKTQAEDEIKALATGADDFVKKPFDPRIVVLRIKKLLKQENIIFWNGLKVDFIAQKIYKDNRDLYLNNKEFLLFKFFLENRGIILSREKILMNIWGFDYFGDERTVDTHIRRLREKIGEKCIKTHRGMGYSLEV